MGGYFYLDIFIGDLSKKALPLYSIPTAAKTHYQT